MSFLAKTLKAELNKARRRVVEANQPVISCRLLGQLIDAGAAISRPISTVQSSGQLVGVRM